MDEKIKFFLEKINLKQDYYKYFENARILKIKSSKDKLNWNFIIATKDYIPVEVLKEIDKNISSRSLFCSGMNIGKDMIGTMTNTLILAFAGEAVATLIVFISYGVQYHQLISSDYLTLELAKGLAGSTAVVLTVPISALICAICYGKHKKS